MADGDVRRRDYRTGSIYQRASDQRWLGTLEAGVTASGARRRITVSGKTKGEVERKLRDKRLELEREGRQNVKRTITVSKWAETWLEQIVEEIRPSAYEADKAAVLWIRQAIGHVKLADLTPEDVTTVAKVLRANKRSTSTSLRYHGALMRMLKAAALQGYTIPPNVLLAKKPSAAVNDRQAVSVPHALKALPHIAGMPDGSRWALAFLQGLRQAEALGLTWDMVDLSPGDESLTIAWQAKSLRYVDRFHPSMGFAMPDGYEARHLIGSTHLVRPKSKAGWRVIPLVPWAASSLRTWRKVAPENPHGLVWPGPTRRGGVWPRNPATDREQWETIQKAVGIEHPSGRPYLVHEIRHGTATLLMKLGVPDSVRIQIMGHSSVTTTHGYEHVDQRQAREALNQMAEALGLTLPSAVGGTLALPGGAVEHESGPRRETP